MPNTYPLNYRMLMRYNRARLDRSYDLGTKKIQEINVH